MSVLVGLIATTAVQLFSPLAMESPLLTFLYVPPLKIALTSFTSFASFHIKSFMLELIFVQVTPELECPELSAVSTHVDSVQYSVVVKNTGNRTGDEVVMVFVIPEDTLTNQQQKQQTVSVPWIRKLTQYQRVHLTPGQSKTLQFQVSGQDVSTVDPTDGKKILVAGRYSVLMTNGVNQHVRCPLKVL